MTDNSVDKRERKDVDKERGSNLTKGEEQNMSEEIEKVGVKMMKLE